MSRHEQPAPVSNLPDDDMQAIPRALVRAAQRAREIAAQTGTPLIVSRAGRVVECPVDPDSEASTRFVIALKGVAGNIGARNIQAAAQALESACQAGEADAHLDRRLVETLACLEPVMPGLAALDSLESDAPSDQADTITASIDREALRALLEQICALLSEDDTKVSELMAPLASLLIGTTFADALRRIQSATENYDFDEALTAVLELQAALDKADD